MLLSLAVWVCASLLLAVTFIIYLTFFPEYIPYRPDNGERFEKESAGVYAGSFNPPHLGHIAILKAMRKRYRRVFCVVGFNPAKTYDVSPQERAELMRWILTRLRLHDIEVHIQKRGQYIWQFAKRKNAVMCRGIRSWAHDGKSEFFLNFLNILGPIIYGPIQLPMKTVFFEASKELAGLSSSKLRRLLAEGRSITRYAPEGCGNEVERLFTPICTPAGTLSRSQARELMRAASEKYAGPLLDSDSSIGSLTPSSQTLNSATSGSFGAESEASPSSSQPGTMRMRHRRPSRNARNGSLNYKRKAGMGLVEADEKVMMEEKSHNLVNRDFNGN
ncbi:hypothetical protein AAMO2058_001108300 [Amorphochlora amoebiformis]